MDTREVVMREVTLMAAGVVVGGMVTMVLATIMDMDMVIAVVTTMAMGIITVTIMESRSHPRPPPENHQGSP